MVAEYKRHCFEPKAKLRQECFLHSVEQAAKLAFANFELVQKACGCPLSYPLRLQLSEEGGRLSADTEEGDELGGVGEVLEPEDGWVATHVLS